MSETLPIDASRDQLVSQRTAELKRMRLLAAGLLVLMTGVFAVTTALAAWWPFLVYPRVCRGGNGGRLRGLVCGGGAV